MKRVRAIIVIVAILVASFAYAHIAKANMIYDKSVDSSEYLTTGVVDGTVEQKFVSVENSLNGISVKCQLNGNTTGVKVAMELFDGKTGEFIAKSELKADDIRNGKFNTFLFPEVQDCAGKSFQVQFKNENADINQGCGISFSFQNKSEKDTELIINGNETEGTLILKTVTDRFDLETFCVLLLMIAYIAGFLWFLSKLFGK